jgi:hypothetical protein
MAAIHGTSSSDSDGADLRAARVSLDGEILDDDAEALRLA